MNVAHVGLVYVAAALAEIAGCFAFWSWLRSGRSAWVLVPGVASSSCSADRCCGRPDCSAAPVDQIATTSTLIATVARIAAVMVQPSSAARAMSGSASAATPASPSTSPDRCDV